MPPSKKWIQLGRRFRTAGIFTLIEKAPASTSSSYGKPFNDIFKEAEYDFYKIDPGLFAPAIYTINNKKTGKTLTVGKIDEELLKLSFKL